MSTGVVVATFRPKFLVLTPICIFLGVACTYSVHGEIQLGHAVLVLIGALLAHASVNALNEYLDFKSGLDLITERTPFSGGTGTLPAHPQAHMSVLLGAVVTLVATILIGLYLLVHTNWILLPIGVLGVVTILFYTRKINHMPWVCLVAPGFAFGPLFVLGTYFSVAPEGAFSYHGILLTFFASLVPFFLVNNLLLLNQLPDVSADKQVGRKTFPIAYGLPASLRIYGIFIFLAALSIILAIVAGILHWLAATALIPLFLLGIHIHNGIMRTEFNTQKMIPYLGKNVICVLITPLVLASSICLVDILI